MAKATKAVAVLLLTTVTACTTVDLKNDAPTKSFLSDKSSEQMRDCILQQGFPSDFGYLKVIPYKGGTLITMDNGIAVPNVIFALHVVPNGSGSKVDVFVSHIGMGSEGLSDRYTLPCVSPNSTN